MQLCRLFNHTLSFFTHPLLLSSLLLVLPPPLTYVNWLLSVTNYERSLWWGRVVMVLGVEHSGTARPSPVPPLTTPKKERGTQPMTNERLGLGLAELEPWWSHSPKQRLICRYRMPPHALHTPYNLCLIHPTAGSPLGTVTRCESRGVQAMCCKKKIIRLTPLNFIFDVNAQRFSI